MTLTPAESITVPSGGRRRREGDGELGGLHFS